MDDRLKFDALYMGATAVTCLIRQEAGIVFFCMYVYTYIYIYIC
jgi:hypothetical protein